MTVIEDPWLFWRDESPEWEWPGDIKDDDRGPRVRQWQNMLADWIFHYGIKSYWKSGRQETPRIQIDGYYGRQTQQVTATFRDINGFRRDVTGRKYHVTEDVWELMEELLRAKGAVNHLDS